MKRWPTRAAFALGAGMALAMILPAAANAAALTQVRLRQSNVVAANFPNVSCDQIPGGVAQKGKDGWVFVLPGNKGKFVSLSLLFKRPNGSLRVVSIKNPNDNLPDDILNGPGTSKAYVVTPSGWRLVSGTAMITGSAPQNKFNLTHVCPSSGGGYPPPPSYGR
jgi:hypothetical protein